MSTPLLEVKNLSKAFAMPRRSFFQGSEPLRALQNVSFTLQAGKSLGIVGESGSGKSTLARLVMALDTPTAGQVLFKGQDIHRLSLAGLREARAGFQMVFQDPYSSLDPRQRVAQIVAEPLEAQHGLSRSDREQRALEALGEIGLGADAMNKYPHEFSGGQRQRIAMARALITRPALIVADEPVSALDVSVQAQVLNLMQDLQERLGLSYLLISHDLAVVDLLADEVLVLQAGQVVEQGPADQLFQHPQHAYTKSLVQAVVQLDE